MSKRILVYTLNMCSLLHIDYISMKLKKCKKTQQWMLSCASQISHFRTKVFIPSASERVAYHNSWLHCFPGISLHWKRPPSLPGGCHLMTAQWWRRNFYRGLVLLPQLGTTWSSILSPELPGPVMEAFVMSSLEFHRLLCPVPLPSCPHRYWSQWPSLPDPMSPWTYTSRSQSLLTREPDLQQWVRVPIILKLKYTFNKTFPHQNNSGIISLNENKYGMLKGKKNKQVGMETPAINFCCRSISI